LVVLLGVVLATMLVRRFLRPAPGPVHGPLRYAGPTPGLHMPAGYDTQPPPAWRMSPAETPAPAMAQPATAAPKMPPGFDPEPFLKHARIAFVRVQAAFDQADYDILGDLLTPEMLSEARAEIIEHGSSRQQSEV